MLRSLTNLLRAIQIDGVFYAYQEKPIPNLIAASTFLGNLIFACVIAWILRKRDWLQHDNTNRCTHHKNSHSVKQNGIILSSGWLPIAVVCNRHGDRL